MPCGRSTCTVYPWPAIRATLDAAGDPVLVTLDVFRHGETVNNAAGLISGAADVALTERGRRQAVELGSQLHGPYDLGYVSPLTRSRETFAQAFAAAAIPVPEVVVDDRIAERSMGMLEGQPAEPLPAYDRGDLLWAPADGEPYISVAQRILSFLIDVMEIARGRATSLNLAVCTHVGPMRVMLGCLRAETDAVAVTTGQYANARLERLAFDRLSWPRFLNGQVTIDVDG